MAFRHFCGSRAPAGHRRALRPGQSRSGIAHPRDRYPHGSGFNPHAGDKTASWQGRLAYALWPCHWMDAHACPQTGAILGRRNACQPRLPGAGERDGRLGPCWNPGQSYPRAPRCFRRACTSTANGIDSSQAGWRTASDEGRSSSGGPEKPADVRRFAWA